MLLTDVFALRIPEVEVMIGALVAVSAWDHLTRGAVHPQHPSPFACAPPISAWFALSLVPV